MKNYSNASRVRFEPLDQIAAADVPETYGFFGADYGNPVLIFDIFNDTDQPILISFDGIADNIYCPSHSGRIYDYGANAQANSHQLAQAKGTQPYIKYFSAAPTTGGVFLGVIYASND